MRTTKFVAAGISLLFLSLGAQATSGHFNVFDSSNGWSVVEDDRGIASNHGGQSYDTEFLFMKYNSDNTLSVGLQTGFDIIDGSWNGSNTYGGDIGLAFRDESGNLIGGQSATKGAKQNTSSTSLTDYNYALDFGYYRDGTAYATKNGVGQLVGESSNGIDAAGLYKVNEWNNTTSHFNILDGGVFAMDAGTLAGSFSQNTHNNSYNDYIDGGRSFYRIVTFDLNDIAGLSDNFTVDAFWTMSCGNDQINGSFDVTRSTGTPIPEPSILALMGIGTLSILGSGLRRRKLFK